MRRAARETAAAFGDRGDRDYEAEFGAPVAPKLTLQGAAAPTAAQQAAASAMFTAPKVATPKPATLFKPDVTKSTPAPKPTSSSGSAPKLAAVTVKTAPVATAAKVALVATVAPKVVAKATAVPTPKPTSSAPAYPDVSHANFLDPASGPIKSAPVLAPKLTPAMQAAADANAKAAAAAKAKRADEQRQTTQASYTAYRAAEDKKAREVHDYLMATNPQYAANERSLAKANTDWGLIPAGAAVLATGAAIIATGGAVAGAIAAPSLATAAGAAVAADRALAAAEKAKLVKPGATGAVGKVLSVAATAQNVIDTTQKLAEQGVPAAIEGAKVLAKTAAERAINGALPGVAQALTPEGAAAFDRYVADAPPALQAALATVTPAAAYPAAAALAARKRVAVKATGKPAPKVQLTAPTIEWFVSLAGKVTEGKGSGSGWRVYSDGKVVKQ